MRIGSKIRVSRMTFSDYDPEAFFDEMFASAGAPRAAAQALMQVIEALPEGEIERRQRAYRSGQPPHLLAGRAAIVIDDGVATGSTAVAALRWARARGAERVVLAVPVAPPQTLERLRAEANEVVVLETPQPFLAVGEWYRDFDQTTDEQVVSALARAAGTRA